MVYKRDATNFIQKDSFDPKSQKLSLYQEVDPNADDSESEVVAAEGRSCLYISIPALNFVFHAYRHLATKKYQIFHREVADLQFA